MENASKALLIAGSILIVLLLIGVGMLIYSRATGVINMAATTMNSQEILAFNSQFTPFEGRQKGSSVRSLISKVIASNAIYSNSREVTINNEEYDATIYSNFSKEINTGSYYTVKLDYGNNGLVSNINYTKQ